MKKTIKIITVFCLLTNSMQAQSSLEEGLKYYPIETGNYWEYLAINDDYLYGLDTSYFSVVVEGDTLMPNGKKYKILKKSYMDNNYSYIFFQRVDSLTANVYEYSNNEYLIDSLLSQLGDSSNASRSRGQYHGNIEITVCTAISNDTLFGLSFTTKSFQHTLQPLDWHYKLASGLGYIGDEICEGTCSWEILAYAEIGENSYGKKVKITSLEGPVKKRHNSFVLYPNYPNPFNPSTRIRFTVKEPGKTSLIVFNSLGERVSRILNEYKLPGTYVVGFNAENLTSGVYYYKLKTRTKTETRKMLLIR